MRTLGMMISEALKILEGEDLEGKCTDTVLQNSEGKILLLKRPDDDDLFPGKYCLPGGHRQDDETILQGAEREATEETGIHVHGLEKLFAWKYPNDFRTTFFFGRQGFQFDDDTVTLSDEHVDYEWVMPAEISKYDLAGDLLEPLLKAVDSIS